MDSGKIISDKSVNIQYKGKNLSSEMKCYWKVSIWDNKGNVSGYSKPGYWEMGLLNSQDWQGKWIGKKEKYISGQAPMFRKEFTLYKEIVISLYMLRNIK